MAYYDEVEIEDLEFDPEAETYFFPCPCGDRFQITLQDGDDVARCPSCSLIIKVIYSPEQFNKDDDKEKEKDQKKAENTTADTPAPAAIAAY